MLKKTKKTDQTEDIEDTKTDTKLNIDQTKKKLFEKNLNLKRLKLLVMLRKKMQDSY